MSHRNWKDTLVGFIFDSWSLIDQHLTGKEVPDDSGAVERYAKTFGMNVVFLGDAAVFYLDDGDLPWEEIDNGLYGNEGNSHYIPLELLADPKVTAKLTSLKEKLEASGLSPDAGPALVHVDEWS